MPIRVNPVFNYWFSENIEDIGLGGLLVKRRVSPLVMSPSKKRFKAGKGFSLHEIHDAGLSVSRARRIGIPVDSRRKSKWAENVKILQELYIRILEKEGRSQRQP